MYSRGPILVLSNIDDFILGYVRPRTSSLVKISNASLGCTSVRGRANIAVHTLNRLLFDIPIPLVTLSYTLCMGRNASVNPPSPQDSVT